MFTLRFVGIEDTSDVVIRPYEGPHDHAAMQRILAACEPAGSFTPQVAPPPNDHVRLVEASGEVVGFGWVRWWPQADGSWLYYHRAYLLPEMQGQGIGTRLLTHIEGLLADRAAHHSRRTRRFLGADVGSGGRATSRLLTTFGYRPLHTIAEMALDGRLRLPTPYLPAGYELREARPADVRPLFDEVGGQHPEPTLTRAAWHGGQLAGAALADLHDGIGRITDLSIAEAHRGTGLERGLLLHAVHALRERGAQEIRLYAGVRATLYETVGFREVETYTRYIKPMPN
jgi:GNAT superfamily N-acetyltransferase